ILAASEGAAASAEASQVGSVRRVIATVAGVPADQVTTQSRLAEDLGYDSLMRAELVAALDVVAKGANLPPTDGARVMQSDTVGDVEAVFRRRERRESPTKKILDDTAPPISLPAPVREAAKGWMREIQMGFYERVMRTKVIGRAHIPQNRATLVVANHCSHL